MLNLIFNKCVNVKVKHIRPEFKNLKAWLNEPNNVYIGRKGVVFIDNERFPKKDSLWHNPFRETKLNNRDFVINQYREYIFKKIQNENLGNELLKLKNKNLGCWCYPKKCHGDVLIELINSLK